MCGRSWVLAQGASPRNLWRTAGCRRRCRLGRAALGPSPLNLMFQPKQDRLLGLAASPRGSASRCAFASFDVVCRRHLVFRAWSASVASALAEPNAAAWFPPPLPYDAVTTMTRLPRLPALAMTSKPVDCAPIGGVDAIARPWRSVLRCSTTVGGWVAPVTGVWRRWVIRAARLMVTSRGGERWPTNGPFAGYMRA
jgi:hypothetical protein